MLPFLGQTAFLQIVNMEQYPSQTVLVAYCFLLLLLPLLLDVFPQLVQFILADQKRLDGQKKTQNNNNPSNMSRDAMTEDLRMVAQWCTRDTAIVWTLPLMSRDAYLCETFIDRICWKVSNTSRFAQLVWSKIRLKARGARSPAWICLFGEPWPSEWAAVCTPPRAWRWRGRHHWMACTPWGNKKIPLRNSLIHTLYRKAAIVPVDWREFWQTQPFLHNIWHSQYLEENKQYY